MELAVDDTSAPAGADKDVPLNTSQRLILKMVPVLGACGHRKPRGLKTRCPERSQSPLLWEGSRRSS